MKKTILALLVTTALTCVAFNTVRADDIAFSGTATASADSAVSGGATVSFTNPWHVVGDTGIFAGTTGDAATMASVSFTGDSTIPTPVVCTSCPEIQWSFIAGGNSYEFHLTALNSATTHNQIAMSGVGFAVVNGVNYSGSWSMNGVSGSFNFITTSVPDGGSAVALLGVALTGIEGVRRVIRRRRA